MWCEAKEPPSFRPIVSSRPSFSLLADLMELEGADGFRIAAYRRLRPDPRRRAASVAQLALDGRAKELQGIGKTIEQKIVEAVEDGEIHALAKRKARGARGGRRLPAPAGAGAEDGPPDLERARDHDARGAPEAAAKAGRLRDLRVSARSRRRRSLPRSASHGRAKAAEADPARVGAAAPPALEQTLAENPAAVRVSIAGSARRFRETVRDLDLIATATTPRSSLDAFCGLPWVVEVAARGGTKATVIGRTASGSTSASCRRVAYGNLLQHFTGSGAQRRSARGRGPARVLGLGVRDHRGRERHSCTRSRVRRRSTRFLGYDWIPPELRENGGELEAARTGEPARPRRARRPARRPAHPHDLVGRQGHARGDGRRRRSPGATTTTRSATTPTALRGGRLDEQAAAIERLNARVADPAPSGASRSNIRVDGDARRRRRGARRARLGCRLASTRASTGIRPTRPRRDGEPLRRLYRPPDRPQDRPARARARIDLETGDREGARDRDLPRDQLPARPARPQ